MAGLHIRLLACALLLLLTGETFAQTASDTVSTLV